MDTLPPIPTTAAAMAYTSPPVIGVETTSAPVALGSTQRVELSVVEKLVIGVAVAITIILIGVLISLSTKS